MTNLQIKRGMNRLGILAGSITSIVGLIMFLDGQGQGHASEVAIAWILAGGIVYGLVCFAGWIIVGFRKDEP